MDGALDDPTDTVPNSPEPLYTGFKVFATLKPFNRQARLAFDSAIDAIKNQPTLFASARRNIVVRSARESSASASSTFTDNEIIEIQKSSTEPAYRFDGHYRFSLGSPPANPQRGWTLGDGRNNTDGGIDFLLSGPRRTLDMAGVHAVIYPNKESCRLMLFARHKAHVQDPAGGITTISISRSASAVKLPSLTEIGFGDCTYSFAYLAFSKTEEHEQQMITFMKESHGADFQGIPPHFKISPDPTPVRLNKYSWSLGAFAQGTFGQVTSGTRTDGLVVAVKRFHKPRDKELGDHVAIMSYIGKHPYIVELLDCQTGPDALIQEAYCFYRPFAKATLYDLFENETLPIESVVTLFRQYLEALEFLHTNKGVMHRDIKPTNLGIVSLNPPTGVVFDLDSATRDMISTDHLQGTLGFLAPEIMALKRWDSNKNSGPQPHPYGRKVDVWALGMSACTSYAGISMIKGCINTEIYRMRRQELDRKITTVKDTLVVSFLKIVVAMLAWEVHKRPSAREALEAMRGIDQEKSSALKVKRPLENDQSRE